EKIIELCPGFVEAIEENEIGQAFGDVNDDKVVDIFDATYVQRHIAGINKDYDIEMNFGIMTNGGFVDLGDFNRDGETTVMDATMIQRHLVGLE
ncbi:MAG: dockerin type I repeat-containing protein, partial [Ruminococcus sp.]|nr:dockerin type I repeat-containing protein [Ruminococcus sp.]